MNTLLAKRLEMVSSHKVQGAHFSEREGNEGLSRRDFHKSKFGKVAKLMFLEMIFLAAMAPAMAVADPNIQLAMSVAKEVIIEENGQNVTRWIEAEIIEPGEKLKYTVTYVNVGDEPATEIRIENPIPELTVYVDDTALGDGSNIAYSADGGENYNARGDVTYEVTVFGGGTDRRVASADRFTNIRWMIEQVPPGNSGEVSFQVVVQ
ncbi:MAG: putative repeat protein (TIGR01451 family) [Candidatus Azotimanducaceae bacterium]|jgi:uncharacterized repeat protein (TIGR01451 family)